MQTLTYSCQVLDFTPCLLQTSERSKKLQDLANVQKTAKLLQRSKYFQEVRQHFSIPSNR